MKTGQLVVVHDVRIIIYYIFIQYISTVGDDGGYNINIIRVWYIHGYINVYMPYCRIAFIVIYTFII